MNVIIANVDLYGDGISTALVPGLKVREFGQGGITQDLNLRFPDLDRWSFEIAHFFSLFSSECFVSGKHF